MSEQGSEIAVGRIESALARIEAAARAAVADRDGLAERHARLRAEVVTAIAALDGLADGDGD